MSGRRVDRAPAAGSSAHYEAPAYYTKTYRGRVEDVRYYVDLAQARGGPVLEYGCGNGRIAIPTARAGVEITGVDLSREMLADLERRLEVEPREVRARLRAVQGDMRSVVLRRRFPLVTCPFNAFLHLYAREDVERFLGRVRAHLAPRGELCFDVSVPEPSELARDPGRAFHAPRFRYPGGPSGEGEMVRYSERFDYDKWRQVLFVAMEFKPMAGGEPWMTPLSHRQFYPQELEALLHYNGFTITDVFGDFFGGAPERSSAVMVVHARASSRSSR